MDNTRVPKHALNYKTRGRRDRGRPSKTWQCVDATEKDDDDDDDF
jgi:predicted ArsR family transcriptional regulator